MRLDVRSVPTHQGRRVRPESQGRTRRHVPPPCRGKVGTERGRGLVVPSDSRPGTTRPCLPLPLSHTGDRRSDVLEDHRRGTLPLPVRTTSSYVPRTGPSRPTTEGWLCHVVTVPEVPWTTGWKGYGHRVRRPGPRCSTGTMDDQEESVSRPEEHRGGVGWVQ